MSRRAACSAIRYRTKDGSSVINPSSRAQQGYGLQYRQALKMAAENPDAILVSGTGRRLIHKKAMEAAPTRKKEIAEETAEKIMTIKERLERDVKEHAINKKQSRVNRRKKIDKALAAAEAPPSGQEMAAKAGGGIQADKLHHDKTKFDPKLVSKISKALLTKSKKKPKPSDVKHGGRISLI